ncbi:unnamed protein product [Mycena citricolor]|uniref:J domain-containing protein n=1 Tax=Mycena citricolor TaxID=2018698 RepID=A0AAD2H5S6_9AGAR|nr:unnamed protein product [Mycena citricolor]
MRLMRSNEREKSHVNAPFPCPLMLSYALSTASSYFYLPVDEEEERTINDYRRKHITWSSGSTSSSTRRESPGSQSSSRTYAGPSSAALDEVLAHDDLYSILGVSRSESLDKLTLRRAYLTRSRSCHPDKFPNNPGATIAFQKIAVAYSVLSQPASRRTYDTRSPQAKYDVFAANPAGHAQDTFRSIVVGVFDDFLEGDLEVIRSFLKAVSDINPSLSLGDEGINSVLNSLQGIRDRALTCRTCVFALHAELLRLVEVQHTLRGLSYFDLMGRSRVTIQLTRITLSLPIALERAVLEANGAAEYDGSILPSKIATLIRGIDMILERMENMLTR